MDKEALLSEQVADLYNKLSWLNRLKLADQLKGMNPSEVHLIEAIEKYPELNMTGLAEHFYLTKGAVSKIVRKLVKKEMITGYHKPANKKEIFFKLTAKGRRVFAIHERLDQEFRDRDQVVYDEISDADFQKLLHFVELYNQHLDREIEKQRQRETK